MSRGWGGVRGPGAQWVPGSGPASRARAPAPARARLLARAPVGACGRLVLPGGGVSPGEPLGGSRGVCTCTRGGLGRCGAGRRAPRGTGSTCLRTDAGSRCSRGEQGTRGERGRETERPVSVRLPLFVDASGCLRGKRVAAAAASRPGPDGREDCARPAACSRTPTLPPPVREAGAGVFTIEMRVRVFHSPRTRDD